MKKIIKISTTFICILIFVSILNEINFSKPDKKDISTNIKYSTIVNSNYNNIFFLHFQKKFNYSENLH